MTTTSHSERERLPSSSFGRAERDAALDSYMRQIQSTPVLPLEDELELGRRCRAGDRTAGQRKCDAVDRARGPVDLDQIGDL